MSSIDNKELFEEYYQTAYDYNTTSLTEAEINSIKELAREKRVNYAAAPLGTGIFDLIQRQSSDIRFEMVAFSSSKIDGMLYIPTTGKERAYIVLNSNKPLANQIFAAAHEFYHYIRDYQLFKEKPYICDFSMLKDVNEKRACRFAAELLFPEDSLSHEVKDYCRLMNAQSFNSLDFHQIASFLILMTVKYQMPLKAVIYRIAEEHYIDDVNYFIENYTFIKKVLQEIEIFKARVSVLYGKMNTFIVPYSKTYQDMESSYLSGNASRTDIIRDAQALSLNPKIINDMFEQYEEADDDDDDEELFDIINSKRG